MLKSLKLHNFKTFLNAEITFSQRHLLIGKNNSGKTNLALAIRFLSSTATSDFESATSRIPGGIWDIRNRFLDSDEISLSCRCELEYEGQPCKYEYALKLSITTSTSVQANGQTQATVLEERLWFDGANLRDVVLLESDGREAKMLYEEQAKSDDEPQQPKTLAPRNATMLSKLYELESNRRAILFRNYLRNWAYFSLSPLSMRIGSGVRDEAGWVLDIDGGNLASAIFQLKNVNERSYRRLIEHVRIVEPSLEAINFVTVPNQPPVPFVDLSEAPRTPWHSLSDGTLRVMGLALCVEQANHFSPPNSLAPSLAVIEEPENGIFPGQLRRIMNLFEEWAPLSQFVFTSHSPYVIDLFDDKRESVTILRKERDRTESASPPPLDPIPDDDRFTLSTEYAAELFQ
ncbi:MAG: AAA family ATPase [Planctomycetaceae bacterium]